MKSYTDINQSKILAEILPLESADMAWYSSYAKDGYSIRMLNDAYPLDIIGEAHDDIPCWSLAALLGVIRETIGYTIYGVNNVYMSCDLGDKPWKLETEVYDNEVEACVDMIIKLHELNLL